MRPRTTEEANVRERSPDEDIFDSLEVALTRIDSSDEEPLVRPTMGRNVLRKVGANSDNVVLLLSSQVARRQGNRFEALADSSAAPDPASLSANEGRHAEPFDASPQRVHAQFDLTEGDSTSQLSKRKVIRQNPTRSLAAWDDPSGGCVVSGQPRPTIGSCAPTTDARWQQSHCSGIWPNGLARCPRVLLCRQPLDVRDGLLLWSPFCGAQQERNRQHPWWSGW